MRFSYDVTGNRVRVQHGRDEEHYRYDEADQLIAAEHDGWRAEYRYDSSGRLVEERAGDWRRAIDYDGFGRPVTVTASEDGESRTSRLTFTGDSLLAALVLASHEHDDDDRAASVRYRWSADSIPQILSQRAGPELDDTTDDQAAGWTPISPTATAGRSRAGRTAPRRCSTMRSGPSCVPRTPGPGRRPRATTRSVPRSSRSSHTGRCQRATSRSGAGRNHTGRNRATRSQLTRNRTHRSCPGSATAASWPSVP